MDVLGIDFTSRPSERKPLTCTRCTLDQDHLNASHLEEWSKFEQFEAALKNPGPWIAGIDFPFGQARRFIEAIGWPNTWDNYVRHAGSLGRTCFRQALDAYREGRVPGDREHRRQTDVAAGSVSPQKLYGVPVGLMFFEGAPRLIGSRVTIPGLQEGDPKRIVVEAYPGVLVRHLVGRASYKSDTPTRQTEEHRQVRQRILSLILADKIDRSYRLKISVPKDLSDRMVQDPTGDQLDSLLCAIQAAWAWTMREKDFGEPCDTEPHEGWIADPMVGNPVA